MRTVQKNVYYCGFCKKHGLSRHAMEGHERRCTLNPDRVCRWRIEGDPRQYDFRALAAALRNRSSDEGFSVRHLVQADIDWLHDEVEGCPACMLAALRQSGVEYGWTRGGGRLFDYDAEVARFRAEERDYADDQERREIEATFI